MKHYILNTFLGVLLGYIFGTLYISIFDRQIFNNYISNMSDFDQTYHGAYLTVLLAIILIVIFEFKNGRLKRPDGIEFQEILLLLGILFGSYLMVGLGNLVFNFVLLLIIGEKNMEYLGGFECGSMAGFLMISLMYTKIKEDRRLRNLY
jgi:hypothetical protein